MARRKQAPKDLTGIRQRGGTYQVRLFGGQDPVTGKQVMLTGSAEDEDAVIKLRDKFRRQVAEATAADWDTFVWLTFITGARRGELLGLAWEHLELSSGLLTIRRNLVRQNGKITIKETETHQMRIVSLDLDTVAILTRSLHDRSYR
jgi:integrase